MTTCKTCGQRTKQKPGKLCPACSKLLPLELFAIDKSRRDGRSGYCKKCAATKARERYRAKHQSIKEENLK